MIIAIDGLAGSGKSSTSKLVAKKLGFCHFSTGKMYRALTCFLINNNYYLNDNFLIDKLNIDEINILVKGVNLNEIKINGIDYSKKLYTDEINNRISHISSIREIRRKMVKIQREVSLNRNIVCEGRDIGTVVFPNAEFKFYFKADLKSRTDRRFLENKKNNLKIPKSILREMIRSRDYKDLNRLESPLKKAKDAILVITTNKTINQQVNFICDRVKGK